ncbi:glycosyltransferase family 2 protein [Kineococcus sp. SYSU DK001]|uniref:glycosyltransferase family 2 protein n=1 Tax=Kineococcus sp. SYSU DK001 TaxID=3383122 RepID=UPI003D7E3356
MLSILLPAARRTAPGEDPQAVWGDLRVALASIAAYAPEAEVVVGWAGTERPADLPRNPRMRLLEQEPGITTGSEAWNWCSRQTDAEELLILGDDCVLHPDTVRLMDEDRKLIAHLAPQARTGFLGARSNYVKGPQNIRAANGGERAGIVFDSEAGLFETDMIVPVAAWIRHDVFDLTGGFPPTNWFADDLMSWDLVRMGFTHYISRAYVHHVGQRATGQGRSSDVLLQEGLDWLRAHRPDFLTQKLNVPA